MFNTETLDIICWSIHQGLPFVSHFLGVINNLFPFIKYQERNTLYLIMLFDVTNSFCFIKLVKSEHGWKICSHKKPLMHKFSNNLTLSFICKYVFYFKI